MNKKIFSDVKVLGLISLGVIAFSVSVAFLQDNNEGEIFEYDDVSRAVIIDQLYDDFPEDWFFQQNATNILEAAGYKVDIFTTQDITVDFYKKLPSMNYNYIVIRTHSADNNNKDSVSLFTGERYQEDKYISEQLLGHVVPGTPLQRTIYYPNTTNAEWSIANDTYRETIAPFITQVYSDEKYFLITPKLVDELMVGKFPGSTFLIGGCDSLSNTSLAQSLIKRGASSIVGWDNNIAVIANDVIMLQLLEETLINNMEIDEAINFVTENYDWTSTVNKATLKHYPEPNL